jgi:hypothetical protein
VTAKRFSHKPAPAAPPCPNEAAHVEGRGHAHAARMSRTHEQERCERCGLWHIWTPLPAGSLIECWWCNERNVDPATLGEDDGVPDEPLCPGCRDLEAAHVENDRRRRATAKHARTWADAT